MSTCLDSARALGVYLRGSYPVGFSLLFKVRLSFNFSKNEFKIFSFQVETFSNSTLR